MELILLEKVLNLGDLGDKVTVKPGYGRNYLVPIPRVASFEELNDHLLAACLADDERMVDRQPVTVLRTAFQFENQAVELRRRWVMS